MPDERGIPTDEEIEKWRARWIGENAYRADDVVRVLREDPESGAKKIVQLPWYTKENGFERWIEEERIHVAELDWRPIADLRGLVLGKVELKEVWLIRAHLEGMLIEHGELSKAKLRNAKLMRANLVMAVLQSADFMWADLRGASFGYAEMQNADLWNADLSEADFTGADLSGAVFGGQDLTRVIFKDTIFHGARLQGVTFLGSDLKGARFLYAGIERTQFVDCELRGFDLYSPVGYAACHTDTFFGRTKGKRKKKSPWLFKRRILKEQALKPENAIDICSEIRLCFRECGLFHKAAIYYEQEEYWRTRAKLRGSLRDKLLGVLRFFFFELMIGYGERPQRVIAWSFGVLIICALVFCGCGFQYETSPGMFESMKYSVFAPFSGDAWMNLLKCLRFSIENFTTLGFSRMQPAEGISHWVASLEGVVGVLFVALATVTWARKAIRD